MTHRLTRAEYANAVRDLLALDIDARSLLPTDDTDQHDEATHPIADGDLGK